MNNFKIKCEKPFLNYVGYVRVCSTGQAKGRKIIGLYCSKKIPKRLTISYARYLVCVREGRMLDAAEQVDHIDGDKTNDCIFNLQILSVKENNKKRVIECGKTALLVELMCPVCNTIFIKEKRNTFLIKGGYYATCSKKCCNKMLIVKKGLSRNKLIEIGQKQKIREFRNT